MELSRISLGGKWRELYRCPNPETVIEFKEHLRAQTQVSAIA
jgi:hypothetical protein